MRLKWKRGYTSWVCPLRETIELRVEMEDDGYWFVDASSYMSPYMNINKPFHTPKQAAEYVERRLKSILRDLHGFYLIRNRKRRKSN
jgi:hypothetical protein